MKISPWKGIIATASVILSASAGFAQDKPKPPCLEPTPQQESNVAAYVAKKNHLTSPSDLTPVKNERANDECFWKFEYETATKKAFVVFLSPDRTFLAPDLYDIRVDPLLEDRKHEESTMAGLLAGDPPLMGSRNAPVSLVEFSDFECPYCQRLKSILEQDVLPKASGKVSIAFKNFPLPMHPWAKPAAMMAACAALQDTPDFWKIHDFLFDNQKSLTADNLTQKVSDFVSTGTSLDKAQFQKCLDKDLTLGIVTKDMALGQQDGVRATPTVFVNGVKYEGVESADQLLAIINSAANGSSAQVTPTPMQLTARDAPNECVKPSPKPN
jgi:protein-disulfide isomerase